MSSANTSSVTGPLSGLRVLELAGGVPAAYCARVLGDLGAEVLQVQDGSITFRDNDDALAKGLATTLDRSKSVFVARTPVADRPDIAGWIDSFAPDVLILDRPDEQLAQAELAQRYPSLVTVALTSFGLTGPRRDWIGSDLVDQAYGGGCNRNGYPDAPPLRAPAYVGDQEVGLTAAVAALLGVIDQRRRGPGQLIDLSAVDAWAAVQTGNSTPEFMFLGVSEIRAGRRYLGRGYPFTILSAPAFDARLIAVQGDEWRRALAMMGAPEWGSYPRYSDRMRNQREYHAELDDLIRKWLAEVTADELTQLALRFQVPWAPMRTLSELPDDLQMSARGYLRREDGALRIGYPVIFSESPAEPRDRRALQVLPVAALRPEPVLRPQSASELDGRVLAGLTVLDFGWAWAGGLVGSILADHGATVVKVESQRRLDPMRRDRPLVGDTPDADQGSLHHNINRNKRSITIDITSPEGAEIIRELIAKADVLVENFSPAVMTKYGLGYADVHALNPELIYLSLSSAGHTGPLRLLRSYAPIVTALGGADSLVGYPGGEAAGLQHAIADPNAALHGVLALLSALIRTPAFGGPGGADGATNGQHLDLSQLESLVDLISPYIVAHQTEPAMEDRIGNRDRLHAPSGLYPTTGEDEWIAISCTTNAMWQALVGALSLPVADARWQTTAERLQEQDEIDELIARGSATWEKTELAEALQALGVAAAPVLNIGDRFSDPHLTERGLFVSTEHPSVGFELVMAPAWMSDLLPRVPVNPAPLLGQHTKDVLRDLLGWDETKIAAAQAAGVLL
jgi:crotonobetainyl-CoA:carnitine CoA-transferase CaiB-like acyl-CoA transferase